MGLTPGAATAPSPGSDWGLVTIRKTANGTLMVDKDPVRLLKGEGDLASWVLQGGGNFDIVFKNDSPFAATRYTQATAQLLAPRSDCIPDPNRRYGYTVKVAGFPDLDPDVIVDP